MNRLRIIFVTLIIFLVFSQGAYADCVVGAKSKTSYARLDTHTILLSGGYGRNILIKTFCFIYPASEVVILKDDFCSFDDAVLYVDGEVCGVNSVQKLD
jgi:hypothetical protein